MSQWPWAVVVLIGSRVESLVLDLLERVAEKRWGGSGGVTTSGEVLSSVGGQSQLLNGPFGFQNFDDFSHEIDNHHSLTDRQASNQLIDVLGVAMGVRGICAHQIAERAIKHLGHLLQSLQGQ